MRAKALVFSIVVVLGGLGVLYAVKPAFFNEEVWKVFSRGYQDGIYEGATKSIYTNENYFGVTKVHIKNHEIETIDFKIIDKNTDEVFDETYGPKHFAGNPVYLDQCKNDWEGVRVYPQKFMRTRDLKKLDAVAGATWSYNMFKDSVAEALAKAE